MPNLTFKNAPKKCEKCGEEDTFLPNFSNITSSRTEKWVCNNCGLKHESYCTDYNNGLKKKDWKEVQDA